MSVTRNGQSPFDFLSHLRSLLATSHHSQPVQSTPDMDGLPLNGDPVHSLDGIRVILSVLVMLWHGFVWFSIFLHQKDIGSLWRTFRFPMALGPVAVDGFLMLTGFVTLLPLCIAERRAVSMGAGKRSTAALTAAELDSRLLSFSSADFWYRRFSRLLPLWLVCYCIQWAAFPRVMIETSQLKNEALRHLFDTAPGMKPGDDFVSACALPALLPVHLLLLTNFIPFGGCHSQTWSMGVQAQFLLLFGFLFQRVCRACTARSVVQHGKLLPTHQIIGVAVAVLTLLWPLERLFTYLHALTAPLPEMEGQLVFWFWYSHTLSRLGGVVMGGVLAILCTATTDGLSASSASGRVGRACSTLRQLLTRCSGPGCRFSCISATCCGRT